MKTHLPEAKKVSGPNPRTTIGGIHPVREALLAERPLERVVVSRGSGGQRLQEIIEICRTRGIPVRFEERSLLDRLARGSTHQGIVAVGAAGAYADLEEVLPRARMLVVLDGIEDPHNLGAIVRTAHAAGASGAVIPERRAAGLTEAAHKAAAGALAYLPVVRVPNVARALDRMKETGFWIYGLDERGDQPYDRVVYAAPSALVLGGEGHGIHQNVRKRCDVLIRIPTAGPIASLNVSVAAGIALYEWRKHAAGLA